MLYPAFSQIPQCGGEDATIVGTDGPDVLEGTDEDDVIVGLGGNDTINGKGGNDIICGGDGVDIINGANVHLFCTFPDMLCCSPNAQRA